MAKKEGWKGKATRVAGCLWLTASLQFAGVRLNSSSRWENWDLNLNRGIPVARAAGPDEEKAPDAGEETEIGNQQNEELSRSLILLGGLDQGRVEELIEEANGRITHEFPNVGLIVDGVSNLEGVEIFKGQVEIETLSDEAKFLGEVWNRLLEDDSKPLSSELLAQAAHEEELFRFQSIATHGHPGEKAFEVPEGLEVQSIPGNPPEESPAPNEHETSEYMAGEIAIGIGLPQCNGPANICTEKSWTQADKVNIMSKIVAGTGWWADRNPSASLRFVFPGTQVLPTSVEPINGPHPEESQWIGDGMRHLGFSNGFYFDQVREHNNDLRNTLNTDWAFTIFVVNSGVDVDGSFADGYYGYAYLGGPFFVLTSDVGPYGRDNLDAAVAHEMGHIFYALDQYPTAFQPCSRRSGYLNVENHNSQYSDDGVPCRSNVSSIMREIVSPFELRQVDQYARGQVGWVDSNNNGRPDVLDTTTKVEAACHPPSDSRDFFCDGTARINPHPPENPNQRGITINWFTENSFSVNGGSWQPVIPKDGVINEPVEGFEVHGGRETPNTVWLRMRDRFGNEVLELIWGGDTGEDGKIYLPNILLRRN